MESSDEGVCRVGDRRRRTAICLIDGLGKAVWRGTVDTHPEMIDGALHRFKGFLDKVGRESGPFAGCAFRKALKTWSTGSAADTTCVPSPLTALMAGG